jgi:hypothetical protein
MIYQTMFPLNEDQPTNMDELLRKFRNPEAVEDLCRQQFLSGVIAGLAFVICEVPNIDLMKIASGPPLAPDGSQLDLRLRYALCEEPARIITNKIERETARIMAARAEAAARNDATQS